jgi:hypothetical protein
MLSDRQVLKPLPLRFGAFGWTAGTAFVYFLAQLAVGTDFRVAILFSLAIVFGLAAVQAGGGFRSAFGILNAVLLADFLLIGIFLKVLMGEPADTNLYSPVTTALVMAFGFLGLWIAATAVKQFPKPKNQVMPRSYSAREYLALAIIFMVFTYGGYLIGMRPDLEGEGLQTGGILGYARAFSSFRSFAIVPVMFYVWKAGHKRFLSHPMVLGVLLFETAAGILATGKQEAVEPLFLYGVVAVMRLGFANRKIWALAALAAVFYAGLVYPYSQYIRYNGGRQGNALYRIESIEDTVWRLLTDPTFRDLVSARIDLPTRLYWNSPSMAPFSRLAMVCEADRLIAATERTEGYTGWETITWGFKLLTPHALLPNKPIYGANNYLAHIAGDAAMRNDETQWAYGVFANFYNAFGLVGVLLGSSVLFASFYCWLTLFFGNPKWSSHPTAAGLGLILILGSYQHSLVENSVSNVIASLATPVMLAVMCFLGKWTAAIFPAISQRLGIRRRNRFPLHPGRLSRPVLSERTVMNTFPAGKDGRRI